LNLWWSPFVDDGVLEIDSNLIENAIRPGALGKRNRLFVGHPEAGNAAGDGSPSRERGFGCCFVAAQSSW
jgi:hypothetical protein